MRVPRVYTAQPLASGQVVTLEAAPSHHLSKVLRMTAGRPLVLFNGQGGEFEGEILETGKKAVSVHIGDFHPADRESPLDLELAIGLSRGDRMDWIFQKATELGATRITPLFTERSEVKLKGERLEKKLEHWQQVMISACEQCQRNRLPIIRSPLTLDDWFDQALGNTPDRALFVLHHRDSRGLPTEKPLGEVSLLVGPEGGLSDDEIDRALQRGCQPLTLGPRVMRTETAPLAAISLAQYLWGDFSK